jgi:hypothetical protein
MAAAGAVGVEEVGVTVLASVLVCVMIVDLSRQLSGVARPDLGSVSCPYKRSIARAGMDKPGFASKYRHMPIGE